MRDDFTVAAWFWSISSGIWTEKQSLKSSQESDWWEDKERERRIIGSRWSIAVMCLWLVPLPRSPWRLGWRTNSSSLLTRGQTMWAKSFEQALHTLQGSQARTWGLPALSPQCLARHSATLPCRSREGGRGGQNKSEGRRKTNQAEWQRGRRYIRIKLYCENVAVWRVSVYMLNRMSHACLIYYLCCYMNQFLRRW